MPKGLGASPSSMGKKQPNDRLLENFVATNKKLPRIGHRYRIPPQSFFFLPLFLPRAKEEQLFIRVDGDLFFPEISMGTFGVWTGGIFGLGKRNFSGIDAAEIGVGPACDRDTWKRHGLL